MNRIPEIQRADTRSRRLAILAFAVVALGGVVLSVELESWLTALRDIPTDAARKSLCSVLSWSMGFGSVTLGLFGCYVWWSGWQVQRATRFPLPGATVIQDTVVLTGQAAVPRGIVFQIIGGVLILCATAVAIVSWWFLRAFGGATS